MTCVDKNELMCEIMAEDGKMARRDELHKFAQKHGIKFITVSDLIAYRLEQERFVSREVETFLPTQFGDFNIFVTILIISDTSLSALRRKIMFCVG